MSDDMQVQREQMEREAAAENATRSGIGTRVFVGATRGRSTQVIKYEAFDTSKPETLPTSVEEVCTVLNITSESELLPLLFEGANAAAYRAASDPLSDYINPVWSEEAKAKFKVTVRSYAAAMEISLDEAAEEIAAKLNKKFSA